MSKCVKWGQSLCVKRGCPRLTHNVYNSGSMFDIDEELKKIPDAPGVYLMHDEYDDIIYVGKAKLLKRRVRQYFQSSRNHSPKIVHMVEHIRRFEYIVTDSELEALVLESNLIKKNRPKYNTMLMDDKSYPFIKVTVKEAFPRVMMSRDAKHDNNRYFGPFTSAYAVKETTDLLCGIYKIRTCNRRLPKDIGKERPCLDYHIDRCSAPCAAKISEEDYRKNIDEVVRFLKGNHDELIKNLTDKMNAAAGKFEYEDAAKYRDLIENVKHVTQKQKITEDDGADRDIVGYAVQNGDAVVQVFFIRNGKLLGRDNFHMTVAESDTGSEIISQFIKQYYGGTPYVPSNILVSDAPEDIEVIEEWLSSLKGKKVNIVTPVKGKKEKLVVLASENAALVLKNDAEKLKREEARTTGAVREIGEAIGIPDINRIEAYDISNTNGVESVGSMVVFEKGRPKKHDYRKFTIKTIKGPDDYGSMREVLTRRFKRALDGNGSANTSFDLLPDVLLMDGGKGQVHVALSVLSQLGLDIPVAGMVKDDHHNTRGLLFNDREIPLDTHSEGFKLITRIQDEAHRFAIEFHKSRRSKAQVKSVLDDIPGIGPARRAALLRRFGDIEGIRKASVEELAAADGMNERVAEAVYKFFR